MKSIVEEASSVSKAIEQAWKRADQPTEFSVRIYELAQKNMFGFTSKPAKVALFFSEESKKNAPAKTISHTSSTNPIPSVSKPVTVKAVTKKAPEKNILQPKIQTPKVRPVTATPKAPRQDAAEPWTPEMVTYAENWLRDLLNKLEIQDTKFQSTPQRYHLKISFAAPVFSEEEKNRAFFRNCAHLILQATRNSFKRPLKGFKAILTTEQP